MTLSSIMRNVDSTPDPRARMKLVMGDYHNAPEGTPFEIHVGHGAMEHGIVPVLVFQMQDGAERLLTVEEARELIRIGRGTHANFPHDPFARSLPVLIAGLEDAINRALAEPVRTN